MAKPKLELTWTRLRQGATAGKPAWAGAPVTDMAPKPWKYLLIPHDELAENMTLAGLTSRFAVSA